MFDFGFSEMLVVGVVALVVLGPERLPVVARTAGEWVGKAQRFVAQVKSDISREAELSELRKIQEEAKNLANEVKTDVETAANKMEKDFAQTSSELSSTAKELEDAVEEVKSKAQGTGALNDLNKEESASEVKTTSAQDLADVYGWGPSTGSFAPKSEPKTFTKRYHTGPSVEELASEIERLRRELGLKDARIGGTALGNTRKLAPRSRSNRPRIYR